MSLVLLSYCFPPAPMAEGFVAAKTMGALPYDTDVFCSDARNWSIPQDHSLQRYVSERFRSIHPLALPFGPLLPRLLGRIPVIGNLPDPLRVLNPLLRRALRRIDLRDARVLVTRSYPHSIHLAGLHLKRQRPDFSWIASFSDPWLADPLAPPSRLRDRVNAPLERKVVENADRIVFTTHEGLHHTMSRYGTQLVDKAVVIPHTFDPDLYPAAEDRTSRRANGARVVIRFVGTFSIDRPPTALIEALEHAGKTRSDALRGVTVELVGPVHPRLRSTLETLAGDTVRLMGPVDYLTSLRLMREADALLLFDAPLSSSIYLPSKLIDYVGAARPIVAFCPPGPSERVVHELGGWVADPRSPRSCADALADVVAYVRANREDSWGREDIRSRYTVRAVAEAWRKVVSGLGPDTGLPRQ